LTVGHRPTLLQTSVLTAAAMFAFACNSVLCRLAFLETRIDAASFTTIRLISGAVTLWVIVLLRRADGEPHGAVGGDWVSAAALFAYAAAFSFAYLDLTASTGALLLFGAVQATMLAQGMRAGERLRGAQGVGLLCALGGLVVLLAPGLAAPPIAAALLMLLAGAAWGVYSMRGKRRGGDPTAQTAGNFLRAVPLALALSLLVATRPGGGTAEVDAAGAGYAVLSGALASGVGYAIWYTALPWLRATTAATVQLSVPVLTAVAGIAFLGEAATPRLVLASVAILGGIALVIRKQGARRAVDEPRARH
jgi:drug/metabolite transporter (DMT)-like permease